MFLEKNVYWENSVSKSCSVTLTTVNEFLKFGVGRLLKLFTELSDCDVWQNSFVEKSEIIFSCDEVCLFWKSEWANDFVITLIAKQ